MTDTDHCPCCGFAGVKSTWRNLRVQCYKAARRRDCARYREVKRERAAANVPEISMNLVAVRWLKSKLVTELYPCPRTGR